MLLSSDREMSLPIPALVTEREADIILPPPTALNPIPSLPAALRIDNQEQLISLLLTSPFLSAGEQEKSRRNHHHAASLSSLRQLFVFGSETMRTLIMRQVLSDPQSRTFKGKKKNWDDATVFPVQIRGLSVVGTEILINESSSSSIFSSSSSSPPSSSLSSPKTTIDVLPEGSGGIAPGSAEVSLQKNKSWEMCVDIGNVDVVTYFLRPDDVQQTMDAIQKIRQLNKKMNKQTAFSKNDSSNRNNPFDPIPATTKDQNKTTRFHHRVVYVPQPTPMIRKLLMNCGIVGGGDTDNVSVHKMQLDILPLETDVLSLEYGEALKDIFVHGTPSSLITTVARSILKLQDIVGKIPRIQAFGPVGDEIVRKLLNMTVDEYLAPQQTGEQQHSGNENAPAISTAAGTATTFANNTYSKKNEQVEGGDVTALIIIDRKVDMVTPMLTPLTYEGLLDETLGIDCGFIQVNVNTINPEDDNDIAHKKSKKKDDDNDQLVALGVNGSDSLYAEIRDQHVEKFGSFLQNQAIALRESHSNFTSVKGKKKDLSEIHQFVKQIPIFTQNLRSLTNHIHLAELIKAKTEETQFRERWQMERSILEGDTCYDMLEDLVSCQYPPFRFLELLCLQSLCTGGIKSSKYDSLRRDVVQTYGYEFLFILENLEKAGLLKRRETTMTMLGIDSSTSSSAAFNNLRRSLILVNAEVDTIDPDDISYVSSGYAPIAMRLIQTSISSQGWGSSNRDEILNQLSSFIGIDISTGISSGGLTTAATTVSGKLNAAAQLSGEQQRSQKRAGGKHRSVFVDVTQQEIPENYATALKRPQGPSLGFVAKNSSDNGNNSSGKKPTLMVLFVGGVTYMEIASMRFLSKRPSFPYHIVCCTTKVINGSEMLEALN